MDTEPLGSLQGGLLDSGQTQRRIQKVWVLTMLNKEAELMVGSRKIQNVDPGTTQMSTRGPAVLARARPGPVGGMAGPSAISPGQPGGGGQQASPEVLSLKLVASWTPGSGGRGAQLD